MWKGKHRSRNGFGLIEVIICLSLLGILVPLLVLALNKSGSLAASSLDSVDTVAALRCVDDELAMLGSEGEQSVLRELVEAGGPLFLSYSEGNKIEIMDNKAFQKGTHHLDDAYAIKLSLQDVSEGRGAEFMQRVFVELSEPIQAPYENRDKREFVRLLSLQ